MHGSMETYTDKPADSNSAQPNPLHQESSDDERVQLTESGEDWQSGSRTVGVALIAVLNQIAFGYDVGAVSQCLQPIERTFRLTQLQTGFVTSALNYFAAAGALMVSGALLDRYGRRKALIAAAWLLIAGGVAVAAATSFEALVLGRLLQGLGVGCSWSASGIYVTEIAPSKLRGSLVALVDVAINLGIIVGYCVAYLVDATSAGRAFGVAPWRVSMGLSILPSLLFLLFVLQLPESPRWLVKRSRPVAARRSLRRLARPEASDADVDAALSSLGETHEEVSTWADAALSPEGVYAALLGVFQQLTGTEAILYFAPTVLPGGSKRAKFLGNVGVGSAKFIGELLATYMADSESALLGRRTLTIGGSAGVCVGLAVFAKFSEDNSALPLLAAALSWTMFTFSLGPGPFSIVFVNEVVPTKLRAKSSAWSCFLNRLTSASVALSFLPLSTQYGASSVFALYAVVAFCSTIFYAKTLPETVGVSLEALHGDGRSDPLPVPP